VSHSFSLLSVIYIGLKKVYIWGLTPEWQRREGWTYG
jgi:hypothetical protein